MFWKLLLHFTGHLRRNSLNGTLKACVALCWGSFESVSSTLISSEVLTLSGWNQMLHWPFDFYNMKHWRWFCCCCKCTVTEFYRRMQWLRDLYTLWCVSIEGLQVVYTAIALYIVTTLPYIVQSAVMIVITADRRNVFNTLND